MKYLILMALFISSLWGYASDNDNEVSNKNIVYYQFVQRGMMMNPIADIEVKMSEKRDSCFVKIYSQNEKLGEYSTYAVDTSLMTKINEIVVENKMYEYKSYYNPPMEILDGYTWRLEIRYDDKYYISSGGHQAWPENKGIFLINNLIRETAETGKLISKKDWSMEQH